MTMLYVCLARRSSAFTAASCPGSCRKSNPPRWRQSRYDRTGVANHADEFCRRIARKNVRNSKDMPRRFLAPSFLAVSFRLETAERLKVSVCTNAYPRRASPKLGPVESASTGIATVPVGPMGKCEKVILASYPLFCR